jgi:pimeloyl-ACP methyl ester carboxylesterase
MGAAAAVLAASQDPRHVESLVADSSFASLERTVEHHAELLLGFPAAPFSRVFLWNFSRIGHFDPTSVNILQAARKLDHLPVLLIYGSNDRRMPRSVAEAVYNAIPGRDKRLLFVEGANHGAAYREAPQVYLNAVEQFLAPTK